MRKNAFSIKIGKGLVKLPLIEPVILYFIPAIDVEEMKLRVIAISVPKFVTQIIVVRAIQVIAHVEDLVIVISVITEVKMVSD